MALFLLKFKTKNIIIVFMILTAHIVAAGAISKPVFQNPGLVFLLALVSHYLLDTIPHWDYQAKSVKKDKNNSMVKASVLPGKKLFRNDLLKMGLDASIGTLIAFFMIKPSLDWHSFSLMASLIIGATLPDFITGINLFWKKFPTLEFTKFHHFIHSKNKILNKKPLLGLSLYIIGIVFLLILFK